MTDRDLDALIAESLRARGEQVQASDLRPAVAPSSVDVAPSRVVLRWRWVGPVLAAAVVAAVAVGTAVIGDSLKADKTPPLSSSSPVPTSAAPSTTAPSSAAPSSAAATGSASATSSPSSSASAGPTNFTLGYEPLWPFATFADAEHWRTSGGGSQPWHADAGETALNFTRGYLGFTDIDRVMTSGADSQGAHVGVGYANPTGQSVTAAVLHLVRFGSAENAPWEVVGSDDTVLSIENPPYGSDVTSPLTFGGHITGVDENIHVWVRSLASSTAVGEKCCLPAGGENSSWSVTVPFSGGGTLTLVASTGGHVQAVERFAIHGVHTAR